MSQEILQAFLEKVRGDAAIQAEFEAKCESCVVALAQSLTSFSTRMPLSNS